MSPDYKPKEKKDLIETLIENKTMAAKNSQHSEDKITYQELLDEFCTFYVGGMDTTGHTIANVLFKLKKVLFKF
jgi:cytochrome P450